MPPGHRPRTAFPDIRGPPQKKQTAAQMDTASLSSSYGIISKIFANRFVPESECKSTDFYNNCQILNTLFSKEKDDDMAGMVHNLFSNSIFRSIKKITQGRDEKGSQRLGKPGKPQEQARRSDRNYRPGDRNDRSFGRTRQCSPLSGFRADSQIPGSNYSKDVADEEAPTGDDKFSFRIVYLR